ncbi:MAG: hypothetical protein A2097_11555 [Desulfobacula sp. GWF2_41_7]|nr:MAG: hypothetical protein A2097_11555 [Desulfobacula sp. GWF2_41_7]
MPENILPILNLFKSLAEHLGLICAAAFILLSSRTLQRVISRDLTRKDKLIFIIFFGAFGIFGTYDGNPINGVIANLRAISMIIAGLLGGPLVGFGAGLIAGGHRFLTDIHGLSSFPCGLGTFIEGFVAGIISVYLKNGVLNWKIAAAIGFFGETLHMGLVLIISKPFQTAWEVVRLVGGPMIILNSIGAACLIKMISMVVKKRERRASIEARKAMAIANQTVIHLREGLTESSAKATAKIIHEHTKVAGVAITDTSSLLAYVGLGQALYQSGQQLMTKTTKTVLDKGEAIFAGNDASAGEEVPYKMYQSAIVVPLMKFNKTIGTLKFYGDKKNPLNYIDFEIAKGLAQLFSTQLELQEIQIKAQLLDRAEIKRLQAQINPHFLFNSLNTIASFCRTNSDRARQLLLELSNYLRKNIKDIREYIPLEDELRQVESYLAIENARFGDRIRYKIDVAPDARECPIPPLIIQPLVENAVKHGISVKVNGGMIRIEADREKSILHVRVIDNGVGIPQEIIDTVFCKNKSEPFYSSMGLKNVNQRLEQIYGPLSRLKIESSKGHGTTVRINIPYINPHYLLPGKGDGSV